MLRCGYLGCQRFTRRHPSPQCNQLRPACRPGGTGSRDAGQEAGMTPGSGPHPAGPAVPMIVQRDLPVPMDDGLVLRADVFRPDGPGPFPVIMSLGPYGKGLPFSSEWFAARWERLLAGHPEITDGSSCVHMNWETVDPERWIPHGYAVVRVDSRGAGRSPGLLDLLSAREIRDFYLAIEWAGTRSWSNGRIGLCGISYYAINQWLVAASRPPGGPRPPYRDVPSPGGILSNGFFERWYPRQVLPMQHGRGTDGPPSPWVSDGLAAGPKTRPEAELRRLRTDYLQDIRGHGLDDGWQTERSADLGQIEVPLLSAANWGGLGLGRQVAGGTHRPARGTLLHGARPRAAAAVLRPLPAGRGQRLGHRAARADIGPARRRHHPAARGARVAAAGHRMVSLVPRRRRSGAARVRGPAADRGQQRVRRPGRRRHLHVRAAARTA